MDSNLVERVEKLLSDYSEVIDSKINMKYHIANTEAGAVKQRLADRLDYMLKMRHSKKLHEATIASLEKQVYENIYQCLITHFDKRKTLFRVWVDRGYVKDAEFLDWFEYCFEKINRFIRELNIEEAYKVEDELYNEIEDFMRDFVEWAYKNGLDRHDLFNSVTRRRK